jgi:multicomponent Na+:H+ antiporter subunit G
VTLLAEIIIVVGALFALLAAVGVHRFPDVFTRMHTASKATSLGLVLVVIGTAIIIFPERGISKLAVVAVFQLLTIPVASHLVGRAAYADPNTTPVITTVDELRGATTLDDPGRAPGSWEEPANEV